MATFLVPHVSGPSMHGHCYNDFNIPLIELRFVNVQTQQSTRAEHMSILKVFVLCIECEGWRRHS